MKMVYIKDIDVFISERFGHYKEAIILGKGPTFKPVDSGRADVLVIAINEAVNQSDYVDMIIINDIETYEKINSDKFQDLKFILTPRKIHKNATPHSDLSYIDATSKITEYFTGSVIPYNLKTTPIDENYITLDTAFSGGNNAADFIGKYLSSIKRVTFFGVGSKVGYCESFKTDSNQHIVDIYSAGRIDEIRRLLLNSLKEKEVIFK